MEPDKNEPKIKVPLPKPAIKKLAAFARKEGRSREKQARILLLPIVEALPPN